MHLQTDWPLLIQLFKSFGQVTAPSFPMSVNQVDFQIMTLVEFVTMLLNEYEISPVEHSALINIRKISHERKAQTERTRILRQSKALPYI